MWTTDAPTAPGYYWWRETIPELMHLTPEPIIRHVKQDKTGLYVEGMSALTLETLGGEWQPVAPPVEA